MKQTIGIGSVVDDGTGDYLRKGGEKINSNFAELYQSLGDGHVPHPAGAWKNVSVLELAPKFGESYNIDTTATPCAVTLPLGSVTDYGKVIKIRDVWGTWNTNNVTIIPQGSNTIKGAAASRKLDRDFQDIELVFSSPGKWEYLDNKMINRLSSSDIATVARVEVIATANQTDFIDVFGETPYNVNNIEVYRRGNLLYYGKSFSADSDFGSPGAGAAIVALDSKSIRLRVPCDAGDAITIVTYLDDLAVYRSSYVSNTVTVWDVESAKTPVPGQTIVANLAEKVEWNLTELGFVESDGQLNPKSVEVLVNGRALTRAGTGGLPAFACETTDGTSLAGDTETDCIANGGQWVESGLDFSILENDLGKLTIVKIKENLENGDQLTVRWFNNDIGTVMDWEDIKEQTDDFYLNNEYRFTRKNRIRYNDYSDPNPCTSEIELAEETNIKFNDVLSLLDSIYPVGTVYMNAHNKSNPSTYMGFGKWVPYAQGQAIVGWDDGTDANFSYYTGACGTLQGPGGSGGSVSHTIQANEIPQVTSVDEVLIKDDNGEVAIGQCLLDPEDDGPGYRRYREDQLTSNNGAGAVNISLLQPYVTVAAWLRVG